MERFSIDTLQEFCIGQVQDYDAMTGCTSILAPQGAVCGVDVRGGSPGTRDTDALSPLCNREVVHAILLTGGSAFGLDAAAGLMELLESRGIGRDVGVTVVPNVCAAVLFDLGCGSHKIRPDKDWGYRAGLEAFARRPFQSGNFGAGTGATVGKAGGRGMKGGIGAAAFRQGALYAAAVFAVNAVGDVLEDGKVIAGGRAPDGSFSSSEEAILAHYDDLRDGFARRGGNTVIGCVLTNAALTKAQATKLAGQGQNAIARTIRPAHTTLDGDTVFALCTGQVAAARDAVGILAARAAEAAILDAVKSAETYGPYLAWQDLAKEP